jgi:hypothetical protein
LSFFAPKIKEKQQKNSEFRGKFARKWFPENKTSAQKKLNKRKNRRKKKPFFTIFDPKIGILGRKLQFFAFGQKRKQEKITNGREGKKKKKNAGKKTSDKTAQKLEKTHFLL